MNYLESTFPKGAYVLVVSGDPDGTYRICEKLGEKGLRAMGAMDASAALDIMKREVPDMVILDMNLGEAGGGEVIKRIRTDERMKDMKVIALTAGGDGDRLLEGGADAIVKRPVETDGLVSMVERLLAG